MNYFPIEPLIGGLIPLSGLILYFSNPIEPLIGGLIHMMIALIAIVSLLNPL